jgi:hypothetical protein
MKGGIEMNRNENADAIRTGEMRREMAIAEVSQLLREYPDIQYIENVRDLLLNDSINSGMSEKPPDPTNVNRTREMRRDQAIAKISQRIRECYDDCWIENLRDTILCDSVNKRMSEQPAGPGAQGGAGTYPGRLFIAFVRLAWAPIANHLMVSKSATLKYIPPARAAWRRMNPPGGYL